MQVATNEPTSDTLRRTMSTTRKSESETVEVLNLLLVHSIHLRDIYRNARWRTADLQFRMLRPLFDAHYKEQIRLVDVLVDRIRELNGAGGIFAGDSLLRTQFSQSLCGRASATHLLAELLDAHESVLNAALPTRTSEEQVNGSWTRDFGVGQAVLTNDEHSLAVRHQLMHRKRMPAQPTCDC